MSDAAQLALFIGAMPFGGICLLCWISKKERGTWKFWK